MFELAQTLKALKTLADMLIPSLKALGEEESTEVGNSVGCPDCF